MIKFSQIEKKILEFWDKNKIFEKSLKKEHPKGDFIFYDGPPFATGSPHYGHIVASLMKDIAPRYYTMRGYRVERKWGWDCHGLPIENIVEQELKLNSRKDIEELGVDKFNESCRSKVLLYAEEWKKVIHRLGRWVDIENDYKTMDKDFMESVWWVFKTLWDEDLIYEDYKSMHICPRCETTLSQSEVSQGYLDVKDLAVTVKFELENEPGTYILAWTTTPWTLPGNTALALGEEIDYVRIKSATNKKEFYIISKVYYEENKEKFGEITKELKGKDLIDKKYKPLFDYFLNKDLENKENLYTIHIADFVTAEDGTGIVHIAPAFGEDDMNLGKQKNLAFIQHVKMNGQFTEDVVDFAGEEVRPKQDSQQTDKRIIKYLEEKNLLFDKEEYEHSYPHCWRCDTPLLNYATSSLFVRVTQIKQKLLENAKKIHWVPIHLKKGRFGKWLEGARDWSISRQRFWGSVIPLWICEKCGEKHVFGSIQELEEISGEKINDLHKHFVDKISFKCKKCSGKMKRTPDVLDCWFESGSMPYAQMHYPFENKEKFENNFPAEFIAEGVDQTRAWFYYLHVLSTAIKNKPAYKNVVANGIVLDSNGKKMAKKLRNYPDPMKVMENYGSDAMRYYFAASSVMKAEDLNFSEEELKEQIRFFTTLYNVFTFYQMFETNEVRKSKKQNSLNILDQWILAKVNVLTENITERMNKYDINSVREIPEFINDLSVWYIRRSRNRFKNEDNMDKQEALIVLHYVLLRLSFLMAPFMPFFAEYLYKELKGEKESVHLENWPSPDKNLIKENILSQMEIIRKICELGHNLRAQAGIRVRQPLSQIVISGVKISKELEELIKAELNIKEVVFTEKLPSGKIWQINQETETKVAINTEINSELKKQGILRELVRQINSLRKQAGLTKDDLIEVYYQVNNKEIEEVLDKYQKELKKETVSKAITKGSSDDVLVQKQVKIEEELIVLVLKK